MRDLYNRPKRLKYWISRIDKDLQGSDNQDLHALVSDMQDRERSSLWIVRCITALLTLRKQLKKPFKDADREDIRGILKWMEEKRYKASTNEKYRQVLKIFYKTVHGKGEEYPDCVKWFSVKLSKEKSGIRTDMDLGEYLEVEEVKQVVEAAPTVQKKAFLACLYESGARPEEFLRLTNRDISIDTKGIVMILRGKTGERRIRIFAYAKLLTQWLNVHPLKAQSEYPLWISEATNFKNQPLGLRGAEKIIEQAMPKTELKNKHARLYIMRHSRATFLAKHLSDATMCAYFGWVQGTKVVARYIHLSGKGIDATLIALNEGQPAKAYENTLKTVSCVRCSEAISPNMNFCSKCALPIALTEQYLLEAESESKNKENEQKLQELQEQHIKLQTDFRALASVIGAMNQSSRDELAKLMYQKGVYHIQANDSSVIA